MSTPNFPASESQQAEGAAGAFLDSAEHLMDYDRYAWDTALTLASVTAQQAAVQAHLATAAAIRDLAAAFRAGGR